MTLGIPAFALGIAWLQTRAQLPVPGHLGAAASFGLALFAVSLWRPLSAFRGARRSAVCLAAFLIGVAWAGWLAHLRLADALPEDSEGRDVVITGVVTNLPQRFENGWRFNFRVEQASLAVPRAISLAWYQSQHLDEDGLAIPLREVHAGERWRLTVRLKRPHGNLNPHGFDFEAWLLEQNIRATGYVRARGEPQRLDAFVPTPGNLVERLREAVRSRFQARLGDAPATGILVALAVGDQRGIPQW